MNATTLFELLSSDRRRRLLSLLCRKEQVRMPDDLRVRGEARGREPRSSDDRRQVSSMSTRPASQSLLTELTHVHVPKLEREGVVDYDADDWTVRRGPRFDEIEPALEVVFSNAARFPEDLL